MRKLLWLTWCVLLAAGGVVRAEDDAHKADEKPEATAQWHDRLSLAGDLRLRYEGFDWSGHFDDGRRDRLRYRFRLGLDAQVLDNLRLGFQLRSGNAQNPISDNQSFDGGFGKKSIAISEAYASWQAARFFSLTVGKFSPTSLWSATDMEWDDDVVAEGALEKLNWKPGGIVKTLDLNLYQYVLNESGSAAESYMFGEQVVSVFGVGEKDALAVGASFEAVTHPESVAALYFGNALVIDAGYVTNFIDPDTDDMVSDFRVGSLFLEWQNKAVERWPIKLSLSFYKNFGAGDGLGAILPASGDGDALAVGRGTDNDAAWFGRIQVGDYKKPGQVAVRFSRYDSKPDAIFFAYSQSDTQRSSNVDGYRVDLRVGTPGNGHVNVTWYRTRWTLGEDSPMNRWQLDYIFAF